MHEFRARFSNSNPFGSGNTNFTVSSSTLTMSPAFPLTVIQSGRPVFNALFSSQKNRMSSAVNGAPSDHFIPLRKLNVHSRWSGDTVQDFAMFGRIG